MVFLAILERTGEPLLIKKYPEDSKSEEESQNDDLENQAETMMAFACLDQFKEKLVYIRKIDQEATTAKYQGKLNEMHTADSEISFYAHMNPHIIVGVRDHKD